MVFSSQTLREAGTGASVEVGARVEDVLEILNYINNFLYVTLAVAAFRSWQRQGGAASAWVAATFATLAAIGIVGLIEPQDETLSEVDLITVLTILGIVFFPYGLYRFTSALRKSSPTIDHIALGATLAVGVWTFFLGDLLQPGEPRPLSFNLYVIALLLQFGGLLVTVAVRLWGAGKGQPTLARRRMRVLSVGSIGITLALVLAGTQVSSDQSTVVSLLTSLLAAGSVLFFFFGFAPPAMLRIAWRRPEQDALRHATERLVAANTPEQVLDTLLPHVTRTLGAQAAVLVDEQGRTLGSHGGRTGTEEDLAPVRSLTEETVHPDLLRLDFEFGSLIIWASPYTPFFGQEEVELLRTLGVLTGLALERTELYRREQEARAAAERANSQLQEANAGLIESRARLAEAQSIAHIGSFSLDPASNRVDWSDQMYELFGMAPGSVEVDYTSYLKHVHPDDQERVDRTVREAIEKGESYSFDHRIVMPDGSSKVLHGRGRVELDGSGTPVRVTGTAQDVTQAREAERRIAMALHSEQEARRSLEALNAEMESFVYTVSHDLNSPIIAIQGFSDFLSKDFGESLPEKGRFYIERINVSAVYLQSLIKDLLQFSRVGRTQTEIEDVSLQDIAAQAADEVGAGFDDFAVTARDLPVVRMNPVRARQLFTNLMQNSARYAGRTDVRIAISAQPSDDGLAVISMHDNGPGIPEQARSKVFAVFERLHQTGKTEGSGMGLPICKKIVETSGGRMWIADSDEGLDLRFTLPLATSDPEPFSPGVAS